MTLINSSNIRVGIYLKIITPEFSEYYYQNFSKLAKQTSGQNWDYVPIDFTPPARNLDLDNTSAKAILPNVPEIRQAIEQNNGFRDAIVETQCIFPDNPDASPYSLDLMVIQSTRISGMSIEINLQSPFSAVAGRFPSIYWTTGTSASGLEITGFVPEVPVIAQVKLS